MRAATIAASCSRSFHRHTPVGRGQVYPVNPPTRVGVSSAQSSTLASPNPSTGTDSTSLSPLSRRSSEPSHACSGSARGLLDFGSSRRSSGLGLSILSSKQVVSSSGPVLEGQTKRSWRNGGIGDWGTGAIIRRLSAASLLAPRRRRRTSRARRATLS